MSHLMCAPYTYVAAPEIYPQSTGSGQVISRCPGRLDPRRRYSRSSSPVVVRCLFRLRGRDQVCRASFDVSNPGLGSPLDPTPATNLKLPLDPVRYRTDKIHDRVQSCLAGIPRSSYRISYVMKVYVEGFRFSFGRLRPRFADFATAGDRPPDGCQTRQNRKKSLSCVIPNKRQLIFTTDRSQMT